MNRCLIHVRSCLLLVLLRECRHCQFTKTVFFYLVTKLDVSIAISFKGRTKLKDAKNVSALSLPINFFRADASQVFNVRAFNECKYNSKR